MRAARSGLVLLILVASPCRAGEVPDPLFWGTKTDFLKLVEGGQFVDRLELHLLQYSAPSQWRSEWAAKRFAGCGLFGEYGSTTGTELYVNSQVALNVFPAARFQLRYERRDYRDGRFDVSGQRLDVLWYPAEGWAVVLSGWPTFEKETSALGLGIRLGSPGSRNAFELRVEDERFLWNQKADGGLRFRRQPVRFLADGFREKGPWRFRGSVDYGLPYEAAESRPGETTASRWTRGSQRFADVEVAYAGSAWTLGARVTGALLERSQSAEGNTPWTLDRSWGRATVSLRRDLGDWTAATLVGWASQRDVFSSPDEPAGDYALDSLIFGLEASLQAARDLALSLGYFGSSQQAERTASTGGPLPSRVEDVFLDKAHVRATYAFKARMSIELLLSQALRGGSFGGGSLKALFAF